MKILIAIIFSSITLYASQCDLSQENILILQRRTKMMIDETETKNQVWVPSIQDDIDEYKKREKELLSNFKLSPLSTPSLKLATATDSKSSYVQSENGPSKLEQFNIALTAFFARMQNEKKQLQSVQKKTQTNRNAEGRPSDRFQTLSSAEMPKQTEATAAQSAPPAVFSETPESKPVNKNQKKIQDEEARLVVKIQQEEESDWVMMQDKEARLTVEVQLVEEADWIEVDEDANFVSMLKNFEQSLIQKIKELAVEDKHEKKKTILEAEASARKSIYKEFQQIWDKNKKNHQEEKAIAKQIARDRTEKEKKKNEEAARVMKKRQKEQKALLDAEASSRGGITKEFQNTWDENNNIKQKQEKAAERKEQAVRLAAEKKKRQETSATTESAPAAASSAEDKQKETAQQREIDSLVTQAKAVDGLAKKDEKRKKKEATEKTLIDKGDVHTTVLMKMEEKGIDPKLYIDLNHEEIFKILKLTLPPNHPAYKNAEHMLVTLVKTGYALNFSEQYVQQFSTQDTMDSQDLTLHLLDLLSRSDRYIDKIIPIVRRFENAPFLKDDDARVDYLNILIRLAEKGKEYQLADKIVNAWKDSQDPKVKHKLVMLCELAR